MPEMNDLHQPWYVCVNTNKQFVNDGARGPEFLEPASVIQFTPEDPRPAAEGEPRTVTFDGKKVPGLLMDEAGRFYNLRKKEIPLVGLEIRYAEGTHPRFFSLDEGLHTPLVQAPIDDRGNHLVKQTRGWFIRAKRLWDENLQSVPEWAK